MIWEPEPVEGRWAMAIGGEVVVAGGGIGGLASALLLAEAGASVTVLERLEHAQPLGAGLLLQANGLAVLEGLGLAAELEGRGNRLDGGVIADAAGRPLVHVKASAPALALRRTDLAEVMGAAAAGHERVTVRPGAEVVAASPDGRVELRGGAAEAGLVVGADGTGSRVRAGGDFGARVRPVGTTYVRGLVAGEDLLAGEFWTPLGLFGGAGVGGSTTYFYASAGSPVVAEATARRDLDGFRAAWEVVLPAAVAVLERLSSFDELLVNDVVRVDCERWHHGRLVLVGDAAHAMAPTMGQGANSALVDAAVLAAELAKDGREQAAALAAYTARRRPAVRRVQDGADRLARLSAVAEPRRRALRDAALRLADRAGLAGARQARLAEQESPAWLLASVRALRGV